MLKLIIATLLIGAFIPMQAPMNATLACSLGHPLLGALVSLTVSN